METARYFAVIVLLVFVHALIHAMLPSALKEHETWMAGFILGAFIWGTEAPHEGHR